MMKEIIKKTSLLVLTCILCAQGLMPVMAQPSIDPDRLGSINIHRFAGSTAANPSSGIPLNGIPYIVQRVRVSADVAQTPENLRDPDNYEPVTGVDAVRLEAITVDGIASFPNLPHGIYRVTEGEHTITPAADRVPPFIVGIPRRGTEEGVDVWIYDVNVFPKSEADEDLGLDKELDLAWDETLGELVATWRLETVVPRLIGNATLFEFVDPLDERLTFISGSIVGTYLRMEEVGGVPVQVEAPLPPAAFTYDVDPDNVLTISLTTDGFAHLSTYALFAPEGTLVFTFRTSVSMLEADLGPFTNDATLLYNDNEIPVIDPPEGTQFAIEVEKIDVNGDRLREATFELFLDEAGNQPAFPVNGVNRAFTTIDGVAFIPGLQAGTFYLRETIAPEGYRLITDMMRIVVGEDYTDPDRSFVVTLQVVNEIEGGFNLPTTGGMGTLLFTVIGLAFFGGAITLILVARHRRQRYD